ncbi:MAG: hypothetical protein ACFFG0_01835 [Candidatus Thorarchaeota archaeon]
MKKFQKLDGSHEICKNCKASGVVRKEILLDEACRYCGGEGVVDWVAHATNNPSPNEINEVLKREVTFRNVHYLINSIKSLLHEHGVVSVVEVKVLNNETNFRANLSDENKFETLPIYRTLIKK